MHRKFAVEEGDHLTMLNVYEAFIKVSTAATRTVPSIHPFPLGASIPEVHFIKELAKRPLGFPVRLLPVLLIRGLGSLPVCGAVLPGRTQALFLAFPCPEMHPLVADCRLGLPQPPLTSLCLTPTTAAGWHCPTSEYEVLLLFFFFLANKWVWEYL